MSTSFGRATAAARSCGSCEASSAPRETGAVPPRPGRWALLRADRLGSGRPGSQAGWARRAGPPRRRAGRGPPLPPSTSSRRTRRRRSRSTSPGWPTAEGWSRSLEVLAAGDAEQASLGVGDERPAEVSIRQSLRQVAGRGVGANGRRAGLPSPPRPVGPGYSRVRCRASGRAEHSPARQPARTRTENLRSARAPRRHGPPARNAPHRLEPPARLSAAPRRRLRPLSCGPASRPCPRRSRRRRRTRAFRAGTRPVGSCLRASPSSRRPRVACGRDRRSSAR